MYSTVPNKTLTQTDWQYINLTTFRRYCNTNIVAIKNLLKSRKIECPKALFERVNWGFGFKIVWYCIPKINNSIKNIHEMHLLVAAEHSNVKQSVYFIALN